MSHWVFGRSKKIFLFFLPSEIFRLLSGENPCFRRVLLFLHLFVMTDLWVCAIALTMTLSTKTTQKLNISGLDFLFLVLQISNSFNLNAFFSFFLQFNASWLLHFALLVFLVLKVIVFPFETLLFPIWLHFEWWRLQMLRVQWRRERSQFFSDIPAWKLAAGFLLVLQRKLPPLFFRLNAGNATIYPAQRR